MENLIKKLLRERLLREEKNKLVDFNSFPDSVRQTLKNEYYHWYVPRYDWNEKQDEFQDNPEQFKNWLHKYESVGFINNLDKLITKTREDLITLKRVELAEKSLKYFEELIKPALGNDVLVQPLSKFAEKVLMQSHSIKDIEQGFENAKKIFDEYGNIDSDKVTTSKIFIGGDISLPNFERFISDNPDYTNVFKDWKKLFDKYMQTSLIELNAYRDSTSYSQIKELYEFLSNLSIKLD